MIYLHYNLIQIVQWHIFTQIFLYNATPQPTSYRRKVILLDFLQRNLNMEFKIYYHPFINGDKPNIVILKNCGAIVISVNEWNLDNYTVTII